MIWKECKQGQNMNRTQRDNPIFYVRVFGFLSIFYIIVNNQHFLLILAGFLQLCHYATTHIEANLTLAILCHTCWYMISVIVRCLFFSIDLILVHGLTKEFCLGMIGGFGSIKATISKVEGKLCLISCLFFEFSLSDSTTN